MDIVHSFNEYFEILEADTEALKNEVYKLRFQVYCIETGFESPDNFPDRLEINGFEDVSEHYLIRHIQSGEFAATTRLILPDPNTPERLFPIEQHCEINRTDLMGQLRRSALAEVSRFCVSKNFKKRKGEQGTVCGVSDHGTRQASSNEQERRVFPHITLALIACLLRISRKHNITYWLAVMEPALIRFLKQLGIDFTAIGPLIDYHGNRQPCVIEVTYLLEGARKKNPDVFEMLTSLSKPNQR